MAKTWRSSGKPRFRSLSSPCLRGRYTMEAPPWAVKWVVGKVRGEEDSRLKVGGEQRPVSQRVAGGSTLSSRAGGERARRVTYFVGGDGACD